MIAWWRSASETVPDWTPARAERESRRQEEREGRAGFHWQWSLRYRPGADQREPRDEPS